MHIINFTCTKYIEVCEIWGSNGNEGKTNILRNIPSPGSIATIIAQKSNTDNC